MLLPFFRETIQRLKKKSPKYFFYLQIFFAVLFLLGFVPTYLHDWFGICVGEGFEKFCEDVSKTAAGAFAASSLTANDTTNMPLTNNNKNDKQ